MYCKSCCNTWLFNKWIEEFLIKELKTGQIVIMDKVLTSKTYVNKNRDVLNASFHKSKKTREPIEQAGCNSDFSTTLLYVFETCREVLS